jgi:hypothetical protein
MDYQAVNPHLFNLDIPSVINMTMNQRRDWTYVDELSFERMTAGVISMLMSIRG